MNSQIRQILNDLKLKINANPETSNYVFKEDDETFIEAEKALVDYFIELIDGVVPKPTSIELMGVEKAKAELRAKLGSQE